MFKEYTVNNIIDEIIDYRGKTPKKLGGNWSEVPTEYMALSAKNIKSGRIVQTDSIRFVSESIYKKWMKQEVDRGTILITSEAPFGELLYWDSDEKIVLSQRLFGLKIKKILILDIFTIICLAIRFNLNFVVEQQGQQ